jgi:hypothetical protein
MFIIKESFYSIVSLIRRIVISLFLRSKKNKILDVVVNIPLIFIPLEFKTSVISFITPGVSSNSIPFILIKANSFLISAR